MILYNITVIIDDKINEEWLDWMNTEFIPVLTNSDHVTSNRFLRVIDSPNEGITYCVQLIIDTIGNYQQFQETDFPQLMADHSTKFANSFVSFSTLMEFIDQE